MHFKFNTCLLLAVFLLISAGGGQAQVTTATFYGIVTDPTGAVMPGARVTLTHEGTGAVTTRSTDAQGEVVFNFLPVGAYTLRIEGPGFKAFESRGLELLAAQNLRRSFALELGAVTETVAVSGMAALVNTVAAEQRESFSRTEVTELPLSRRNYSSLLGIGTGVTYTTDSGNGVRLNGLGKHGTYITVDGTDASANPEGRATSMYQGFNYIDSLSIEAVQEVQTVKGVVQAEYGQSLAGNVNLITKSGTNDWHGSAFENFQAEDLAARNQFLATKPPLTFNQFGGSLGGPIRKDKIFAFGVYEGYRESAFQAVEGTVPTVRLRNAMLAAVPDYKAWLDTLPAPNQPSSPDAPSAPFVGAGARRSDDNHVVAKSDLRLWSNSNLAVTYTRGRPNRIQPRISAINYRQWAGVTERGTVSFVTGRARWTSETRFGYNHNDIDRADGFFFITDPKRSGSTPGLRSIPDVSALGFGNGAGEALGIGGPTWTLEHKVAYTSGRHSFKFGGIFSHRGGGRSDVENPVVSYENEPDLLANIPSRIQVTFGVNPNTSRSHEIGFFAQDDWRVNPKLVVNVGLRYDLFSNFVVTPTDPARPAGLFNLNGLLDNKFNFGPFRDPNNPFEPDYGVNLGPRIGFSYNPDGRAKTVVRGGFSVMFSPLVWGTFNNAAANSTTLPFRVNFVKTEAAALGLKYPVYNQDILPLVQGRSSTQIQTADVINPNIQAPYSMNVSIGIQREITSSMVLETAFVGNRGVKFFMYRRFNPPDRVTGLRPNPGLGEGNYEDSSQNTVYASWQTSLRKRYSRHVSGGVHYTWAKSLSYTGGDIGATFQGDARSTVQEFFNWRAERSPSTGDVTHYFAADWVYDLPLFSSLHPVAKRAIGGWQVSGIFRAQTGEPLVITQPSSIPNSRPDYVGGNAVMDDYRQTLVYLNRAAFLRVPTGAASGATVRPGNLGVGAIRGPGLWNMDASIGKEFLLKEKWKFQFRTDLFNAFNHTNFSNPTTNITSGTFGRILSTRGARVIQLNARLSF